MALDIGFSRTFSEQAGDSVAQRPGLGWRS